MRKRLSELSHFASQTRRDPHASWRRMDGIADGAFNRALSNSDAGSAAVPQTAIHPVFVLSDEQPFPDLRARYYAM